ncbi:MAG: DUF3108 domain-containing protein [Melioribacteraceae bacterium]|nr:DUF3108 domain-containing protein [Melioribacteraceae bacterium]
MKKLFMIILITQGMIISQETQFRVLENKAFSEGEKLTFNVNYGFITAGIAEMEIPQIKRISGREAYHIMFRVNSVPSFDPFFKVRDRYETYMDAEGLFPWRFEQHVREGKYKRDFSAFFDQRRGIAKTKKGSYEIPPYVHDIVSAFYFVRTLDYSKLIPGDKINLQNFYKDSVYPLDVEYHGKETVTVEAGTFDCIMIEPLVKEGGLFKNEGSIIIWLTDDEVKMPVKVKTKVIIGSIDAELKSYEGILGELASRKL